MRKKYSYIVTVEFMGKRESFTVRAKNPSQAMQDAAAKYSNAVKIVSVY